MLDKHELFVAYLNCCEAKSIVMKSQENLVKSLFGVESLNVEFKEKVPYSEKYVKTVIAFANGNGGKIVFGIEDESLNVVGIDEKEIFEQVDAVTNAIYDSCEPRIMPNVTIQEVKGKLLIVAEIYPGMQKPYFYKSLGMTEGTFIRVSGTTRKAPQYVVQELLLKGTNRSFDQIDLPVTVTSRQVSRLCNDIYRFIVEKDNDKAGTKRKLTKNQLLSWKIIKEIDGKIYPTNAYMLLAGNEEYFPEASIQCAVFKGNSRADLMLTKKEFKGPIYQQIDDAYNFVIQHIDVKSPIEGLYRREIYELPPIAIREIITNAVCHRSYLTPGKIQVALYDDRLEITSPGSLDETLTIEKLKAGLSKIRNKAIATVFEYMEIVETWGSGVPKIIAEAKKYGLKEPKYIDLESDLRVILYRNKTSDCEVRETKTNFKYGYEQRKNIAEFIEQLSLKDKYKTILRIINENHFISTSKIALISSLSVTNVKYYLKQMKELCLLHYIGNTRKGYWEITMNDFLSKTTI